MMSFERAHRAAQLEQCRAYANQTMSRKDELAFLERWDKDMGLRSMLEKVMTRKDTHPKVPKK